MELIKPLVLTTSKLIFQDDVGKMRMTSPDVLFFVENGRLACCSGALSHTYSTLFLDYIHASQAVFEHPQHQCKVKTSHIGKYPASISSLPYGSLRPEA